MSNCSRLLESRSKADTTATRPSWSKAHSPIKSRPARSGAVTTSPVWPTNLSEGTCLGPCGFGSDQPGTPPFRFSQLWGGSDLSLERGVLRICPPVAPVRLEELLPRVGRRGRGLAARRHLPRGVGGWLLRAKEEECGAAEPTCADRTAVSTCAAVAVVVDSQTTQEAESGMGGCLRRVLVPSP
jgi:hypothetical protein